MVFSRQKFGFCTAQPKMNLPLVRGEALMKLSLSNLYEIWLILHCTKMTTKKKKKTRRDETKRELLEKILAFGMTYYKMCEVS